MEQLTLGELMDFVETLLKQGMSIAQVRALPIYLGNDDELNGIHWGWDVSLVDADDKGEDNMYVVEMMDLEKGKAILIS